MTKEDRFKELVAAARAMNEEKDPDVKEVIKDLIDTNWSKSQESAGKAVNMLKGLAFSKDPMAEKFIKDLDQLTNTMEASKYE